MRICLCESQDFETVLTLPQVFKIMIMYAYATFSCENSRVTYFLCICHVIFGQFSIQFRGQFFPDVKIRIFLLGLNFLFLKSSSKIFKFRKNIFFVCFRSTSVVKSADFKSFSFSFYFYGSLVYHLRRLFPVKLSGNSLSLSGFGPFL